MISAKKHYGHLCKGLALGIGHVKFVDPLMILLQIVRKKSPYIQKKKKKNVSTKSF